MTADLLAKIHGARPPEILDGPGILHRRQGAFAPSGLREKRNVYRDPLCEQLALGLDALLNARLVESDADV